MSEDNTIQRIERSIAESSRQAQIDAAAERAKWERCDTPRPLQRENAGPSERIVQPGRRR
jgi:hypothetical protein